MNCHKSIRRKISEIVIRFCVVLFVTSFLLSCLPSGNQCPDFCDDDPCVDYAHDTGDKITGPCTCVPTNSRSSSVYYCCNYEVLEDPTMAYIRTVLPTLVFLGAIVVFALSYSICCCVDMVCSSLPEYNELPEVELVNQVA